MLNELKSLQKKKNDAAASLLLKKVQGALRRDLKEGVGLLHQAFKKSKGGSLPFAKKLVLEKIERKEVQAALNIGNVILKHCPGEYKLANTLGNFARQHGKPHSAGSFYQLSYQANPNFETAYLNLSACEAGVNLYDDRVKKAIAPFETSMRLLIPKINYFKAPEILHRIFEKICLADALKRIEKIQFKVFEQNIEEHEDAFKALEKKADSIRKNLAVLVQETTSYSKKLELILNKIEDFDWRFFKKDEQKTLKWEIYNFAVTHLSSKKIALSEPPSEGSSKTLELVRQLLLTLKVENSSLYYPDMLLAIISYIQGDLEEAVKNFEPLLEKDANNRFYNVNLGLLYLASKNKRMGFKHLLVGWKSIRQFEGKFQILDLIELAKKKQENQEFTKAIQLYKVILRETDDPKIHEEMGQTLMNLKAWDEAISVFQRILGEDRQNKMAQNALDRIYATLMENGDKALECKHFRETLDFYKKAIAIHKTVENMKQLASVYKAMGKLEEHTACLNEISQLELQAYRAENRKKWKEVVDKAHKLLMAKKYTESFKLYEHSFEILPDKKTYVYLCKVYQKMKYFKALEKLTEKWMMIYRHQIKG